MKFNKRDRVRGKYDDVSYTGTVFSVNGGGAAIKRDDGGTGLGETIPGYGQGWLVFQKPDGSWGGDGLGGTLKIIKRKEKMNKKQALEKIEELKVYIKGLNQEPWKPEMDQKYFVWDCGKVNAGTNYNSDTDKGYQKDGNQSETEKEAEMFGLRLASMKQRGPRPKKNGEIWCWDFGDNEPCKLFFGKGWSPDWWLGSVKKTKEECEAWNKAYGRAWE